MTTQIKKGDWYFNLIIKNKKVQAILNQAKTIDSKRLERKIARIGITVVKQILEDFKNLLTS